MKILYLCTHQIHNLTPLFREISKNKKINFKVLYWQRILADYHDPEFDKIINFGIDQFGESAPYKEVYDHFNLTEDKITSFIQKKIRE